MVVGVYVGFLGLSIMRFLAREADVDRYEALAVAAAVHLWRFSGLMNGTRRPSSCFAVPSASAPARLGSGRSANAGGDPGSGYHGAHGLWATAGSRMSYNRRSGKKSYTPSTVRRRNQGVCWAESSQRRFRPRGEMQIPSYRSVMRGTAQGLKIIYDASDRLFLLGRSAGLTRV